MTTWIVDRPTLDIIQQAVHDVSLANVLNANTAQPQVQFAASTMSDLPPEDRLITPSSPDGRRGTPHLVVFPTQIAGYANAVGTRFSDFYDEDTQTVKPMWDTECYALWPFSLDEPHYNEVSLARIAMFVTWHQVRDMSSVAHLWTDAGINPNRPVPYRNYYGGERQQFVKYPQEGGEPHVFIGARWVVRTIEQLKVTQQTD